MQRWAWSREALTTVSYALLGFGLGIGLGLHAGRHRRASLRGRVALVTGGSRGLGLELARELGRRGARVAICARDPETLERAQADLEGRRIVVLALAADVSEPTTAAALAQRVVAQFGGLDVLVNNAGVITVDPLATAALPFLRASEEGRVVNVVSVGRKIAFSEGLAAETRAAGVRVTTVYSGLMRTGSPRHTPVKGRHRRAARRIVDAVVRGERTAVLTLPARLAVAAHAALPGTTIRLLALVNRQG